MISVVSGFFLYLRFIYILSWDCRSFIFTATWYLVVWLYHTTVLHSTVDRTIMKNAAINVLVHVTLSPHELVFLLDVTWWWFCWSESRCIFGLFGFYQLLNSGFTSLLFHQRFLLFHILASVRYYRFLIFDKNYGWVVVAYVVFIWICLISHERTPFYFLFFLSLDIGVSDWPGTVDWEAIFPQALQGIFVMKQGSLCLSVWGISILFSESICLYQHEYKPVFINTVL